MFFYTYTGYLTNTCVSDDGDGKWEGELERGTISFNAMPLFNILSFLTGDCKVLLVESSNGFLTKLH